MIDEPTRRDRSKYAALWERLHDPVFWQGWHLVDRVRGGGLRDRLEHNRFVGLRKLDYEVRSHRQPDGTTEVWIRVTGLKGANP